MEYKEELRISMKYYPRLFLDEEDFLHHVFFVNGNGYEWVEGELCSDTEEHLLIQYNNMKRQYPRYYGKTLKETRQKEIEHRRFFIENMKDECGYYLLDDGRLGRQIYPICQYAKIVNIPENIKPDWLNAAHKAIQMAESPLFKLTEIDKKWLAKAKDNLDKIKNRQGKK